MVKSIIGLRLSSEGCYESAEIRVTDEYDVSILFSYYGWDDEDREAEFVLDKNQFECICNFIRDKP